MALKRIKKEIKDSEPSSTGVSAGPEGADLFHWTGVILGPKDSLYEDGVF